ncbi:hypothetical protein [Variovorax sp. GB1P17]|uniref:hypothetical protein n=1 Tax=Variovorax sp. GB1P17 TaxID=3443740 RepID=UPI003F4635C1
MHPKRTIAAAMLLLPLAALESSAHRPDPFEQDFKPSKPVYRIEQRDADPSRQRSGAGAAWGGRAGAGLSPSGWRPHSLERYDGYRYSSRDADGDGMPDRWDRHPNDPHRQ